MEPSISVSKKATWPFGSFRCWCSCKLAKPIGTTPCFLGCPQQTRAGLVPRAFVLEGHLAEPRESIPDVRRVVDRQTTSTARIEGASGRSS